MVRTSLMIFLPKRCFVVFRRCLLSSKVGVLRPFSTAFPTIRNQQFLSVFTAKKGRLDIFQQRCKVQNQVTHSAFRHWPQEVARKSNEAFPIHLESLGFIVFSLNISGMQIIVNWKEHIYIYTHMGVFLSIYLYLRHLGTLEQTIITHISLDWGELKSCN